jgi:hypothetical protein
VSFLWLHNLINSLNDMNLRIHGDNIIECERALKLIESAYGADVKRIKSSIHLPTFQVEKDGKHLFTIDLLAGHDRWNTSIKEELAKHGAPLREATDAYVTQFDKSKSKETILLAIEFCSALPAGNNAWQRSGRALTCSEIGIPYFYFAEIGGVELDEDRNVKAPRFPNPIVPFSYLTTSKSLDVVCVPIYEPHPAISDSLREKYMHVFGLSASLSLIKCLIDGSNYDDELEVLLQKGLALVQILSGDRKKRDTFRTIEWTTFLEITSGQKKAKWLSELKDKQIWQKKASDKVAVSDTFKQLLTNIQKINCLSIGARDIPISLIDTANVSNFMRLLESIYPISAIKTLVEQIKNKNKPLLIVWITGFKPKGDDSRPDRGLVPLARMIFGNDIDILTIVYGPAKESTWSMFKKDPNKLAQINGLWEAVFNLSNYVLADSITSKLGALTHFAERKLERKTEKVVFSAASPTNNFSEHDVDTAIHLMFSNQAKYDVFEGMCNPPGGDWSGVSVLNYTTKDEFRWTSLPRVSAIGGKRPDHVIQILHEGEIYFLVIESKGNARDLEDNIGRNLSQYLIDLFSNPPTAVKKKGKDWKLYDKTSLPTPSFSTISGGAFIFKNQKEIDTAMRDGSLDFIIAFEFGKIGDPSVLHVKISDKFKFLDVLLNKLTVQI